MWTPSVFVARQPCSARHFWSQRVRQAYDDFAQPFRLAGELALLPLLVFGTRRFHLLPAIAAAITVCLAEAGRRRNRGTEVFPASSALWAPLWLLERSLAVWAALWLRLAGGVPYAGVRIRQAGHSVRRLKRMLSEPPHAFAGGTERGAIRLQAVASAETEARRTASQR